MIDFTYEKYVEAVLSGEQPAGESVIACCRRHVDDVAQGKARGIEFDHKAARVAISFFYALQQFKGEWAGEPLALQAWQQFIVGSLFGWKRVDTGLRRFKTAYVSVARKNGKTTLAAGIGLYLMLLDGEPGAEVFTAATKKDQARIAHSTATEIARRSAAIRDKVKIVRDNLSVPLTASKFEPLGRDADTLDGLNPHGVIADEVHKWKTGELWDILETGTGARRQPLMIAITTAGDNLQSLCFQLHDYAHKVNEGLVEDDSFFGIYYSLDQPQMGTEAETVEGEWDDYTDPATWVKANPNLEVSKKREDMLRKLTRAQGMPARLNAFLRYELNIWTRGAQRWLDPRIWRENGRDEPVTPLAGRRCYAGLDLSSTTDVTALVYLFPPEDPDDPYDVLCRFFIPEENLTARIHDDRVPYDVWIDQGYVEATPGDFVDYSFIIHRLEEDSKEFDVTEIAFDRWGAAKVYTALTEKGYEMVQFGQGFASMSAPTKELERLILARRINHLHNPVLSWMADNVVLDIDAAENHKPNKKKSIERIDGVVALIMAVARADAGKEESVYQERGLREL